MHVMHIVPPQWEERLGRGPYRMTFVDWIAEQPDYAELLRKSERYTTVDTQSCEKPLTRPHGWVQFRGAARHVRADQIVLPDIMGEPQETFDASVSMLGKVPWDLNVMFVPQARSWHDWTSVLAAFLKHYRALGCFDHKLTIGLSGLRQETGVKPQKGTRSGMMVHLNQIGLQMHILGLRSVREFVQEELPMALDCGVRSVDTCAAFTLGVRGVRLTKDTRRLYVLEDLSTYDRLSEGQLALIEENMDTLDSWTKGD